MSKLKPLAGYVLIRPFEEEETTASGLVMPEKEKEKPAKGKVLAVGNYPKIPDTIKLPEQTWDSYFEQYPQVKEGDIVIFHRWSGQDIKEGQKEYKLVKFSDLMGVYE